MNLAPRAPLVAVKLHPVGRTQTLLAGPTAGEALPRAGESVVVQTEAGLAMATVVRSHSEISERKRPQGDSPEHVVRRATKDDVVLRHQQEHREREAFRVGVLKVREHGLAMKLSRVEGMLDGSKLVFYFTADGRVDFRDLVKDLAAERHTRVEMKQIGVRDEAKMIGGYGTRGRPLCCTTFLTSFEPISIKMAKQQDLGMNPSKLSGLCGRLKCCLRYELPNAKGVAHGGCGGEGGCDNPTGCGTGGCNSCKAQVSS